MPCWVDVPDALRLADLLAALSLTTDLAMGQPPEKAIRACVLATEMARHLDASDADVACVYYTTLLKHLGCTATSHEETLLFGNDLAMRPLAERTDEAEPRELLAFLSAVGRGTGLRRAGHVVRTATGRAESMAIYRAICEVATQMSERLHLGDDVTQALYQTIERWDGKGAPQGLAGEDIAFAARLAEPATQAVIFHRLGGVDGALAMMDRRSGGMFDPAASPRPWPRGGSPNRPAARGASRPGERTARARSSASGCVRCDTGAAGPAPTRSCSAVHASPRRRRRRRSDPDRATAL